jgi:Asp-tRNA(Asn)/Glu-tRNA(Gln) amidotransferase A subunit family amidase
VPFAVKDNIDVAGEVTTFGTRAYGEPVTADAELVRRLRSAGAIVIGKTHVPELGVFPWTESATWGVTRNPWNPEHTPGGSSGGSAAAVAAGLVGAALGNDGGGSIRFPAAYCGLFGLKSQRGRLPLAPYIDTWQGLSVNGVITRTVRDTALFYDAVAEGQHDVGAPMLAPTSLTAALEGTGARAAGVEAATHGAVSTGGQAGWTAEHSGAGAGATGAPGAGAGAYGGMGGAETGQGPAVAGVAEELPTWGTAESQAPGPSQRPLRIGVATKLPPSPLTRLDPDNAAAVSETAELLRGLGHEVRECEIDFGPSSPPPEFVVRFFAGVHDEAEALAHPERLERRIRQVSAIGGVLERVLLRLARAREARVAAHLNAPFAEHDVLLTPVTPAPAPRIGRCEGRGWIFTMLMASATVPYAAPWNMTGQPAASVPAGFGAGGLPRAVQLVGRPEDEGTLIALAAEIEAARPWAHRRPAPFA